MLSKIHVLRSNSEIYQTSSIMIANLFLIIFHEHWMIEYWRCWWNCGFNLWYFRNLSGCLWSLKMLRSKICRRRLKRKTEWWLHNSCQIKVSAQSQLNFGCTNNLTICYEEEEEGEKEGEKEEAADAQKQSPALLSVKVKAALSVSRHTFWS